MQTVSDWASSFLVGMAIFLGAFIYLAYSISKHNREATTWFPEAEGILERVEFRAEGPTVPHADRHPDDKVHAEPRTRHTIVHLRDGRSFEIIGRHHVPHLAGTRIRISVNRLGDRRVEAVAS